jgi:hypothetical protein
MEGKGMMIVFVALKCGTPFEDVEMLNMTVKMANENRRYDCSAGREGVEEFQACLRPAKGWQLCTVMMVPKVLALLCRWL